MMASSAEPRSQAWRSSVSPVPSPRLAYPLVIGNDTKQTVSHVMNPWLKRRGLHLGASRCNRHHDRCPGDIESGVPISVIGISALLTNKGSLTLAVLFCTVAAHMARFRRVGRVHCVQWDTSKSSLVLKKETELPKCPGAMTRTLRVSNRAISAFPDVP